MSRFLKRVYGIGVQFVWNKDVFKIFIATAVPFAVAGIIGRLYAYSDSLLMSKMLTAKELGWWSVPYKITFAFQFVPVALSASVYPVFSGLFVKDKASIGPLFEKSWRYLFAIVFPLAFGLIAIAHPVITKVFGSQYIPSIVPLRILLLSLIFGFLALITGALLNATNKQRTQTVLITVVLIINIILNLVLLPRIGITGAAIAALISNAMLCLVGFYFSVRQVSIDARSIMLYLHQTLWPALAMAGVVYVLSFKLSFLITIPIGAGLYLALLYKTKVLTKDILLLVVEKIRLKPKSRTV
jgi:O-antigen/teichoic acid export membrane protein